MEFKFICPGCAQRLAIQTNPAGLSFACPTCGKRFETPAPDGVQATAQKGESVGETGITMAGMFPLVAPCILRALKILFSFKGRAPRRHFWLLLPLFPLFVVVFSALDTRGLDGFAAVATVLFLWINLAVQVKRWHDLGRSGWMVLVNGIPILGQIYALINLGLLEGDGGRTILIRPAISNSTYARRSHDKAGRAGT